ncbi:MULTISPECIES: M20/M25/M40 family metallo-hydrolase [unclassified Bradyrhizobium]|uniref:M20/M25/M40 family metallo-hydrolase n=1 Tax=unclassified Bradyrhizobium TaxID=2631580 RepID=UPI00247B2819|nr:MULTISPECIES: M20/M25/M40 family metallo-hydrolase [unclassified Bradyrhizobium]WGS22532.1 M20/M25/M40 family metallo-hydrolase [Bradyrhizobium sp. ISRA463]WGS29511.1 M20/M25/M40 family metallo-hydrolase [Bradyrhizobium sp. ISRA464]
MSHKAKTTSRSLLLSAALGSALLATGAAAQGLTEQQQFARGIYQELVEINTTTATGDTQKAAEAMGARLRAAGFPESDVHVFSPAPHKGNLVARLHGSGARKPILLVAHLDVVPANREDWSVDPFKLTEQDGYFYGRGSSDDKYMASAFITNLIRYKKEGYKPDRDIIVALETDEEILDANGLGMQWLIKNHRDLIDAEFALNEGGGVGLKDGKAIRNTVQTSEKVSIGYQLTVKDRGGHSSLPRKDNAIYRLAAGLVRLSNFSFPPNFNETTRLYFTRMAELDTKQTADDIRAVLAPQPDPAALARLSENVGYNAQLRTTCVATMLQGGHAINALPQLATAKVNCRIMPGEPVEGVQATLERVLDDRQIAVAPTGKAVLSPPSPPNEEVMGAIDKLSKEFWPDAAIIPVMSTGATDGSYLRNAGIPTYGHSGLAADIKDNRNHGKDERVLVKSFYEGEDYLYRLVKMLAGGKS